MDGAHYLPPTLFKFTLKWGACAEPDHRVSQILRKNKSDILTELIRWDMKKLCLTPKIKAYMAKSFYYNKYHLANREILELLNIQSMEGALRSGLLSQRMSGKGGEPPRRTSRPPSDEPGDAESTWKKRMEQGCGQYRTGEKGGKRDPVCSQGDATEPRSKGRRMEIADCVESTADDDEHSRQEGSKDKGRDMRIPDR